MNILGRPIRILLVEDNPGDIRLVQEAFRESKQENNLSVVRDGVEAVDFLHKQGNYTGALRPDLIILGLSLPRKDGGEVLAEIKQDPQFRRIPVVVFTSSDSRDDLIKAYDLYANCYVRKPDKLDAFIKVIRDIEDFWLQVACLPPQ